MKRILTAVAIFTAFFLTSCEKIEDMAQFSINNSTNVTIPANTIVSSSPINIPTPAVTTSSSQAFENNNTRADLVKTAYLTNLKMTITSPTDQTFKFLNDIEIYIKAGDLEEVLLASKHDIPATVGNVLELETSKANLKEYVKQDSYSIRTKVVTDEINNRDVDIKVDMTFKVTADIF